MTYKKRIPAEGDFMQKKTNDILYVYLQSISYVDKDDKTFIYKEDINFSKIAQELGKQYNARKISRDFKFLENIGLVENGFALDKNDGKVAVFILPKIGTCYALIPLQTLKYLIHTCNANVIKIYVYLIYKHNNNTGRNYKFSKKELLDVLKLQSTTHSEHYKMIENILVCLMNSGLISIRHQWIKNGKSVIGATQYHILENVSFTHVNPLKDREK